MKRKTAFRLATFAALVGGAGAMVQLGCSTILGLDDTTLRDAAEAGTAHAACVPPSADAGFVVQHTVGWIASDGTYTKCEPMGFDAKAMQVFVRTDGGFTAPFPAKELHDDAIYYGPLPAGDRYVLRPGFGDLYIVTGDRLDLGHDEVGRYSDERTDKDTYLQLKGTPASDDAGEVTDLLGGCVLTGSVDPPVGSPPVWNAKISTDKLVFDGTRGDVAWVTRRTTDPALGYVAEACTFPKDFKMGDSGMEVLSVDCATSPKQPIAVGISSPPSLPGATNVTGSFAADLWPGTGAHGLGLFVDEDGRPKPFGYFSVTRLGLGPLPLDGSLVSFTAVNPAPTTWSTVATLHLAIARPVELSETGTDGGPSGGKVAMDSIHAWQVIPTSSHQTTRWSLIDAVSAVRIGGTEILTGGPAKGVELTPIIVVEPPQKGSQPVGYRIFITLNGAPPDKPIFEIVTSTKEVLLPAGILQSGNVYTLTVETRFSDSYSEAEPLRAGLPVGSATITTNGFTTVN